LWRYTWLVLGKSYSAWWWVMKFLLAACVSKRSGWVVNTPASYSGGPGFKFLFGDRLSLLMLFVVFLSPSR
jgi:hypothetical protein